MEMSLESLFGNLQLFSHSTRMRAVQPELVQKNGAERVLWISRLIRVV